MLAVCFSGNSFIIQAFTDQWVLALEKCPGETFPETRSQNRKDRDTVLCHMDMQSQTKTVI